MTSKADLSGPGRSHTGLLSGTQTDCACSPRTHVHVGPLASMLLPQASLPGSRHRSMLEGHLLRETFSEQLFESHITVLQNILKHFSLLYAFHCIYHCLTSSPFIYLFCINLPSLNICSTKQKPCLFCSPLYLLP